MNIYLSIVVPLYNEEKSVEVLLSKILEACGEFEFLYEIIFVDDGSTDNTWEIIESLKEKTPALKGIKFRRRYGQTSAMVAGFDHASGEIIVCMDGDLQNDPSDIPRLLNKLNGYFLMLYSTGHTKLAWITERANNLLIFFLVFLHLIPPRHRLI